MCFGRTFESMFGNDWIELIRGLLINTMDNIFTRKLPGGYLLFFVKLAKFNEKLLTVRRNGNMKAIADQLKIDPKNMKSYRGHNDKTQSSFNRYNVCLHFIFELYLTTFIQAKLEFFFILAQCWPKFFLQFLHEL